MCYVGPMMNFLCMCRDVMKYGIVRLDTCIDDVGGFPDSKIIHHHHHHYRRHGHNCHRRHQQGLERFGKVNFLK